MTWQQSVSWKPYFNLMLEYYNFCLFRWKKTLNLSLFIVLRNVCEEFNWFSDSGCTNFTINIKYLIFIFQVPREPLVFMIRSMGGEVSWCATTAPGSSYTEEDDRVTHQISDRYFILKIPSHLTLPPHAILN